MTLIGGAILVIPLDPALSLSGLILIGLGLAPIYPGLLHETPTRFGKENAARLIGYQMAVAYTGTTLIPPLFGLLSVRTSIAVFPFAVLALLIFMFCSAERVNRLLGRATLGRE